MFALNSKVAVPFKVNIPLTVMVPVGVVNVAVPEGLRLRLLYVARGSTLIAVNVTVPPMLDGKSVTVPVFIVMVPELFSVAPVRIRL